MTVFTNTFGGSAVSPADIAFAAYSFSASTTLYWPQFSAGQTDIAARFMNITTTVSSLNITLPDATLTSPGQDIIIFNAGAQTFNVLDNDGGAVATITTGQTYYIILTDNDDAAGEWQTVQFGVGTGSASAAALAGAGLLAVAGTLNVNTTATTRSGSYTITTADRGILQVWTAGAGTITLPSASSVGNGFFFPLANNGSGNVTVSAADNIDGATTSVFSLTQSGFIVSSGSTWYTIGKGLQTNFAVTLLNLNVAGSADVTETSAQAQNVIQQYTGVLTGNINVIVPATVQLYYVFNNTTGSFTLTVKTASGTGITIAQGSHSILYCDGTNVVNAFTSSFGGAISISAGSAGAPNFNIVGSVTTGIYSPTANQLAVTAGGFEVMNFLSAASSVNYLEAAASATAVATSITAKGSDSNIGITLAPKGTGSVNIAKAAIAGGTITGITDLAVADGGTGASTAPDARTNLGLGTMATQAASAVAITGGTIAGITDLAVADGGTGASTASAARGNLGFATTTVDNTICRFDSTAGQTQSSGVVIDDSNNIYGFGALINAQTGTTYTVQDTDAGKTVTLSNASAITVTVPNSLAVGFTCNFIQQGAGQVTFAAGSSATQHSYQSLTKIAGQYAGASLLVTANAGSAAIYTLVGTLA